ncbi:MAG: hypothetical protein ABI270_08810 [Nitrosospira sp.]
MEKCNLLEQQIAFSLKQVELGTPVKELCSMVVGINEDEHHGLAILSISL